ncbi:MAG: DUF1328 domain-containing protein [Phycisphaerales bacterium]|nr:DUF1328 domain-containing protein [Hyphomonadaceae bacterium]
MLNWAIGFFIAAIVAAIFGFGGIATAFTSVAILLFWVFVALFVLSLLFNQFGGAHAASHGRSGGAAATLALIIGVGLVTYAWTSNDMTAESVGRTIDRETSQLAGATGEALSDAGDRAQSLATTAGDEIRSDTAEGLDEAGDTVEGEND